MNPDSLSTVLITIFINISSIGAVSSIIAEQTRKWMTFNHGRETLQNGLQKTMPNLLAKQEDSRMRVSLR